MIVHDLEQRSDAWYALRAGKPTASEFSRVVTSKGEESKSRYGYALTLAAEVYAGGQVDAWGGNAWTERGREIEAEAITRYEFQNDVDVVKTGFITDDAGTVGCSPDGLVGDHGMIEVKCLKAERHIEAILYYRKHGTAPPDYIQQTQGQLWIAERRWCDLCLFHPSLPLLVIRQEPVLPVIAGLTAGIPLLLQERDAIVSALRGAPASSRKAA